MECQVGRLLTPLIAHTGNGAGHESGQGRSAWRHVSTFPLCLIAQRGLASQTAGCKGFNMTCRHLCNVPCQLEASRVCLTFLLQHLVCPACTVGAWVLLCHDCTDTVLMEGGWACV